MSKDKFPPRHVDPAALQLGHSPSDDEEDEEEEFDLIGAMKKMDVHERRKVYAMKGLLSDYRAARAKFLEELALLQKEHLGAAQRLQDIRSEIVSGARDITDEELALATAKNTSGVEEIPSDKEDEKAAGGDDTKKKPAKSARVVAPREEKSRMEDAAAVPNGGIPDFWMTAMSNTEVFESMIMERDRHALSFLKSVSMEYVEGDPQKGVQINFFFAPNEYFGNEVLTKTFRMSFDEDSGEMEIDSMKASPIEWKSSEKNLTITIKKKKQRHKNGKDIRVVNREEKCPSFFNFFTDPIPEDDDEEEDEDAEEAEAEAELHIEAGQLLMEEIIPKAAFYYTGKSVEQVAKALQSQFGVAFDGDDDDDEEEEEEEEEEEPTPAARGGRGGNRGRAAGGNSHVKRARGGRGGAEECKQQ